MSAMQTESDDTIDGLLRDGLSWISRVGRTYALLWGTAMVAPWKCARTYIVDRDQTRAIGFVMVMISVWLGLGAVLNTASWPVIGGLSSVSFLIWLALLAVFVAPIAVHVLAFIATVVLVATVHDRAPVSETVQVIAFAMAPVVFFAIPVVEVQAAAAVYATALLVIGLRTVHRTSVWRAFLAAVIPAYLLFGVGFGANDALVELLRATTII